jgi:hypothetical protein
MSVPVLAVPVTDADLRWQRWQADGAERDRRRNTRLKAVAVVVGIGLGIAALIQFL